MQQIGTSPRQFERDKTGRAEQKSQWENRHQDQPAQLQCDSGSRDPGTDEKVKRQVVNPPGQKKPVGLKERLHSLQGREPALGIRPEFADQRDVDHAEHERNEPPRNRIRQPRAPKHQTGGQEKPTDQCELVEQGKSRVGRHGSLKS